MAEASPAAQTRRATLVEIAGSGLTCAGSGNAPVYALSKINLSIGKGDFVSLMGPSGCGKNTLPRIVGDLLTPASGAVSIAGQTQRQARRCEMTPLGEPT